MTINSWEALAREEPVPEQDLYPARTETGKGQRRRNTLIALAAKLIKEKESRDAED